MDDDRPKLQKVVIIVDGDKVDYAGFANAAQERQIKDILKSGAIPQ